MVSQDPSVTTILIFVYFRPWKETLIERKRSTFSFSSPEIHNYESVFDHDDESKDPKDAAAEERESFSREEVSSVFLCYAYD